MEHILAINVKDLHESPFQGRLMLKGDEGIRNKELENLKRSISETGLISPVIVRAKNEGYEVIDGHRRVEAYRQLGRKTIECIVKEYNDREAQAMSVAANLQREDLSNIEKALAFKKVLEQGIFKDKRELSKAIGKDETYVGDLLNTVNMDQRIIDDLLKNNTTNDVRLLRIIRKVEKVDENQVSEKQWLIYQQFKKEGLSRMEVQALVKAEKGQPEKPYTVILSANKFHIELNEKLPKKKRDKIREFLEEKMEEILNSL
ncbi:MAG: ParB/RepB/Spo0J family partition protein [Prolixibacteraceae bacterium]|nr:ParB/RepB/Spo0J family partition protein [Prolixibacteraceae bacterium]